MLSKKTKLLGGSSLRKWLSVRGAHVETELNKTQQQELKLCFSLFEAPGDGEGLISPDDACKGLTSFLCLRPDLVELGAWKEGLEAAGRNVTLQEFSAAAARFGYGKQTYFDSVYDSVPKGNDSKLPWKPCGHGPTTRPASAQPLRGKAKSKDTSERLPVDLIALAAHRQAKIAAVLEEHAVPVVEEKEKAKFSKRVTMRTHSENIAKLMQGKPKTTKLKHAAHLLAFAKRNLMSAIGKDINSCECKDWLGQMHFHCRECEFSHPVKTVIIEHENGDLCKEWQMRVKIVIPGKTLFEKVLPRPIADVSYWVEPVTFTPKSAKMGGGSEVKMTVENVKPRQREQPGGLLSAELRSQWARGKKKSLKDVVKSIIVGRRFAQTAAKYTASQVERIAYSQRFVATLSEQGRVFTWGHNSFQWLGHPGPCKGMPPEQEVVDKIQQECDEKMAEAVTLAAEAEEADQQLVLSVQARINSERDERIRNAREEYHRKANNPGHVAALALTQVSDIAVGDDHALAQSAEGQVYSWGEGSFGRLGHNSIESQPLPKIISGLNRRRVKQVACGAAHSLALTVNGSVWAWGDNRYGQLGLGHLHDELNPAVISALHAGVQQISSGGYYSAALSRLGEVFTWGQGWCGTLAHARLTRDEMKAEVTAARVAATSSSSGAGRARGARARAPSRAAQAPGLAASTTGAASFSGAAGAALRRPQSAQAETSVSSSVADDGRARCSKLPRPVARLKNVTISKISCGREHMAAIENDVENQRYELYTWGNNYFGKLGHAHTHNLFEPQAVARVSNIPVDNVFCGINCTAIWIGPETAVFGKLDFGFLIRKHLDLEKFDRPTAHMVLDMHDGVMPNSPARPMEPNRVRFR